MRTGESHRSSESGNVWRLGLGLLLVVLLAFLWLTWLSRTRSFDLQLGMIGLVAIGFIGGLVMRSWLGTVLSPTAIVGASALLGAIRCLQGCRFSQDDTPFVQFMLGVIYLGLPIALGTVLGTPLGKWLSPRRS